jgi:hypothetical protein
MVVQAVVTCYSDCIIPTTKLLMYLRVEVFTAVTMKNSVFWDIKSQFVPHMKDITSPLQSQAS